MLNKNILLAAVAIGFITSSCSVAWPVAVTDNAVGTKIGTAKKKCIFNICGNVNVGIITAAKNGGITKIATVDYKVKGGLFTTTYETIVTGE